MVGAFCLAVFRLGEKPLWLDEAVTYVWASWPFPDLIGHSAAGAHPPLYFSFMHGWRAFDSSEFWLRLPSVIFFTVTIPVVYLLGRTIDSPRTGLYAALLFATSPIMIRFAQEARSYAMLTFFSAVALTCVGLIVAQYDRRRPALIGTGLYAALRRGLGKNSKGSASALDDIVWLGFIIATVAAMLTHHTAVLLPVVTGFIFLAALLFASDFKGRRFVNIAVAYGFIAVIYSLYLPYMLVSVDRFHQDSQSLVTTVRELINVYGNEHLRFVIVAYLALALVALVTWVRSRKWQWALFALVGWLGLFLLEMAVGFLHGSVYRYRTLIWTTIPFYAMIATGLTVLWKPVQVGFLTLLVAANLYGVHAEYERGKEPWDRVAAAVAKSPSDRHAIVFCPRYIVEPFNYYWRRYGQGTAGFGGSNAEMKRFLEPAGGDPAKWRWQEEEGRHVGMLFEDYDQVWVVIAHANYCDVKAVEEGLAGHGRLEGEQWFDKIRLLTYNSGP